MTRSVRSRPRRSGQGDARAVAHNVVLLDERFVALDAGTHTVVCGQVAARLADSATIAILVVTTR